MIGELIPTGVTFGAGRISVNDQFSGTAEFNNVEVSGNLSAGTGGIIYSGGTDLYNIFSVTDLNDITRVQPGSNITTGGTSNNPTVNIVSSPSFNAITSSGSSSFSILSANTIYSGSTPLNSVISSYSGTSGNLWSASSSSTSIIANNGTNNLASGNLSLITGSGNTITSKLSLILGGYNNFIEGDGFSSIINSTNSQITNGAGVSSLSSIIESSDSYIINSTGSTIISSKGSTLMSLNNCVLLGAPNLSFSSGVAFTDFTTFMQKVYINDYMDLKATTLPTAKAGRIFFSGTPLFRLMLNTGGTSADWMIL